MAYDNVPRTYAAYEQQHIARAAYFTVRRFAGRGRGEGSEHATKDEALAAAAAMGADPYGRRARGNGSR